MLDEDTLYRVWMTIALILALAAIYLVITDNKRGDLE
jgi:hypothetical protein